MPLQRPCGRKEEVNARGLESRELGQKEGMSRKRQVGLVRGTFRQVRIGVFILSATGGAKGLCMTQ